MLLAANYPPGTKVSIRPGHKYDPRWRVVGTVEWRDDARLGFFGGEVPDGSERAEVPVGWLVDPSEDGPSARPIAPTPRLGDPDNDNCAEGDGEVEADRYERGLGRAASRRGWA